MVLKRELLCRLPPSRSRPNGSTFTKEFFSPEGRFSSTISQQSRRSSGNSSGGQVWGFLAALVNGQWH